LLRRTAIAPLVVAAAAALEVAAVAAVTQAIGVPETRKAKAA